METKEADTVKHLLGPPSCGKTVQSRLFLHFSVRSCNVRQHAEFLFAQFLFSTAFSPVFPRFLIAEIRDPCN